MDKFSKNPPSDYEITAEAMRAKTERLRALRLERDAANPPPQPAAKRKANTKAKRPAGTLSDWLDGQSREGRRS